YKHTISVFRCKVNCLYLYTNLIGHTARIDPVLAGRTVFPVIVVLPVFHKQAYHLIALLFEQPNGNSRVNAPREANDNTLFTKRFGHKWKARGHQKNKSIEKKILPGLRIL